MKNIYYPLFFLLSAFFFISCEKSNPTSPLPVPASPSFAGNWTGVSSNISFSIAEKDNKLYGTCVYINLNLIANGDQQYPKVSLRLDRAGYLPASFSGVFIHADTISGYLNGSGFANSSIIISRY